MVDELTAEQFMNKMDACEPQIDKALIFGLRSLVSETPEAMKRDNNYILKVVETYPDRYIGAGVVDPSWGDKAIQELHRFVDAGLRVVKMRFDSMRIRANSKAAQRILKEVAKLGVLPLIHCSGSRFSNPFVVGSLAIMFPEVKLVMQHMGINQSHDAFNVARNAMNIYVDSSACWHPKNIARFINEVSSERVMFGSDMVSFRGRHQIQDALNRILCLDLPPEHERKVLGENGAALLRSVGVDV